MESGTAQGILGRWLAEPLDRTAAERLLKRAEGRQRRLARRGARCRICPLMRLAARFWLGADIESLFETQLAGARSAHQRILLRQLYGQLLMSRRMAGSFTQLDTAFREAGGLYAAGDYFLVMRRNGLLRHLPLSDIPLPPLALPELLTTARVAAELQRRNPSPGTYDVDRSDTFG